MAHRPTSADVARLAGVSRTTVSFVLNGREGIRISRATRERVVEAANLLGYQANASASQLARGASLTIGLILHMDAPQMAADALLPQLVHGLGQAAQGANYQVLIESLPPSDGSYRRLLHSHRVDGLIVSGPLVEDGELKGIFDDGFPVVIHGHAIEPSAPSVDVDNVAGARTAVAHLVEHGHNRIAMITNAPLSYASARDRVEGYKLALSDAGIEFDPGLVTEGNLLAQSGNAALTELRRERSFTAVFAASDAVALGAMGAARAAGLRIPDDLSFVGFDDIPLAADFDPPLTTIGIPAYDLGRTVGNILLAQIRGEPVPQRTLLDTALQVRKSVGTRSDRQQLERRMDNATLGVAERDARG
jgi:DNA-binding LacI/PurR family transcriptional regulator